MNQHNPQGLYKEIESHVGTQILEALRAFGKSARILSGNCFQLRHLIQLLEDPADPLKVMGYDSLHRLDGFDEVIRLLHNYLTSITTVVNHSRNLMKEDFVKVEHRQEYQRKIDAIFGNDPFTKFMQDFQNYMIHHEIPGIGLSKTMGLPEADSKPEKLNVDLDSLAKWKKWTTPALSLSVNRPKIRMLKLLDDYEQRFIGFHEKFGQSFHRYYSLKSTKHSLNT